MRHGEYSDSLRALGYFLDNIGARNVEIAERDDFTSVTWVALDGTVQHRTFIDAELEELRRARRLERHGESRPDGLDTAEMLRTLGQEVEEEAAELLGIAEEEDGYRLSWVLSGQYRRLMYPRDEIRNLSLLRRAAAAARA